MYLFEVTVIKYELPNLFLSRERRSIQFGTLEKLNKIQLSKKVLIFIIQNLNLIFFA